MKDLRTRRKRELEVLIEVLTTDISDVSDVLENCETILLSEVNDDIKAESTTEYQAELLKDLIVMLNEYIVEYKTM